MKDQLGVRSWLIACDESGTGGSPYYGFGSLWIKYQRRGDFIAAFRELKEKHQMTRECKWNSASSMKYMGFYSELIEYFFKHQWMVFHCIVVRKEDVAKKEFHDNNWDLARRKHFTMLLTNKMRMALRRFPDRQHEFRIYVDPIASSYQKADEAVEVISNNILNQELPGSSPVKAVITKDSAETPAIQLCDLLLGAVMETWQKDNANKTRIAVRSAISECLGWEDLDADTFKTERKFNIWYFLDTTKKRRAVTSRKVNLKHPYPTNSKKS